MVQERKKLIFVVLDGIGDRLVKELQNRTPLEAAHTPALDKLASQGVTGHVQVLPFAPESDEAVFTLLGYDLKDYRGRGPLEAFGSGVPFKKGMIALRCNFATAAGNKLIDRRVGRSLASNEARMLADSVNRNVKLKNGKFSFKATAAHRAVLVLQQKQPLSALITNTDPAYKIDEEGLPEALADFKKEILKSEARNKKAAAKRAAQLLNEFTEKSAKVLNNDPVNLSRHHRGLLKANVILCRDAGTELPKVEPINKLTKRNWAIAADMPLEIGIGRLLGMERINLEIDENAKRYYPYIAEKAVKALNQHDSIYVHLKKTDVAGHDGDYLQKKQAIEEIDAYFFKPLLKHAKNVVIIVTGDHATPCEVRGHSNDPVPLLVWNAGVTDSVKRFNEIECSEGELGLLKGKEVMRKVCSLIKRKT